LRSGPSQWDPTSFGTSGLDLGPPISQAKESGTGGQRPFIEITNTPNVGPAEIMMAPIERLFIAMTVSGFMGLIAAIAWLVVS
jgi:hypothetical protein